MYIWSHFPIFLCKKTEIQRRETTMLASSSSSSSSAALIPCYRAGWPFESSEQNYVYKAAVASDYFPPPMEVDHKPTPSTVVDDAGTLMAARKLNHNACERDRRKKINLLFSSLRSVLPLPNQRKRLSNPATVSQALRYIPNLQKQVEELVGKKKQLLSVIARRQVLEGSSWETKAGWSFPLSAVSTNRLNDREVSVQISTFHRIPLSCILLGLQEEDGLHPLNISSSLSSGGRVFYHLHLQVEKQLAMIEYKFLNEKVMRSHENIDYL